MFATRYKFISVVQGRHIRSNKLERVSIECRKGRDTLGDKSQQYVSATSCSMCTTCKTSHCDTTPVRSTRSDLV